MSVSFSTRSGRDADRAYFTFDESHRTHQEQYFDFGPRWRCLKSIRHRNGRSNCSRLSCLLRLLATHQFTICIPLSSTWRRARRCTSLRITGRRARSTSPSTIRAQSSFERIPASFFSHIRSRRGNASDRDVATFDLTLIDEEGMVLAEIDGFSMRQVRDLRDGLGIVREPQFCVRVSELLCRPQLAPGDLTCSGSACISRIIKSQRSLRGLCLARWTKRRHSSHPRCPPGLDPENASTNDDVETVLSEWWQELLGIGPARSRRRFFRARRALAARRAALQQVKENVRRQHRFVILFRGANDPDSRTAHSRGMHDDGPPAVVESGSGNYSGRRNTPSAVCRVRTRRPCARLSQIGTASLSEDQSVYGLVPRGIDGTEPYDWRVEDIAAYYVQAIRIQQPDGPYRVVGHSFGGIVAFEVAQQLVASGGQVSFVGLLDTHRAAVHAGSQTLAANSRPSRLDWI